MLAEDVPDASHGNIARVLGRSGRGRGAGHQNGRRSRQRLVQPRDIYGRSKRSQWHFESAEDRSLPCSELVQAPLDTGPTALASGDTVNAMGEAQRARSLDNNHDAEVTRTFFDLKETHDDS